MGNALDWSALPLVLDLLEPGDPELVIHQLVTIRDQLRERSD